MWNKNLERRRAVNTDSQRSDPQLQVRSEASRLAKLKRDGLRNGLWNTHDRRIDGGLPSEESVKD